MTKEEATDRWSRPDFLAAHRDIVLGLFANTDPIVGNDLAGIVVGDEGPLGKPLHFAHFQQRQIVRADFRFATLRCSLYGAQIRGTNFSGAVLNSCAFANGDIEQTLFEKGRFESCTFSDAELRHVSFAAASFRDRRALGCVALRAKFTECDFTESKLMRVEFRASRMVNCRFDGAQFKECDLRGVKFEVTAPGLEQCSKCDTAGATLDGKPLF